MRHVAVIALAGSVALAACGSGERPRSRPDAATQDPLAAKPVPAVPADLARSFGILRRPRTSRDAMPHGDGRQPHGANPKLARRAGDAPLWVLPADGHVCLVYRGPDAVNGGCADLRLARTGLARQTLSGPGYGLPRGRAVAYGIVPDGLERLSLVMPGGGTRTVRVRDGVWRVQVPDRRGIRLRVGRHDVPLV